VQEKKRRCGVGAAFYARKYAGFVPIKLLSLITKMDGGYAISLRSGVKFYRAVFRVTARFINAN
jgi:hypothetical protein